MEWSLLDQSGRRKYLVTGERAGFVRVAREIGGPTGSFCLVLAFTGARISEVLALTPARIDEGSCALIFQTLKRRRLHFRAIPVPGALIELVDQVHGFRAACSNDRLATQRIWNWSRTTAWKRVKTVMSIAGIADQAAMPKALRHAFGVQAVNERIALSVIQKWLGHARIETTSIYTTPLGEEERALAELTWRRLASLDGQKLSPK